MTISENPRPYEDSVLDEISKLQNAIASATAAAGLKSELFIAAPIAREMNKNLSDYSFAGFNPQGIKNFFATNQLTMTPALPVMLPITDKSLAQDIKTVAVENLSNVSSVGMRGDINRALHPSMNDVGIAKINEGTAARAVDWYAEHLDQFGNTDSLGLLHYQERPATLVRDLMADPIIDVKFKPLLHAKLKIILRLMIRIGIYVLQSGKRH